MNHGSSAAPGGVTRQQWLVLLAALLGWMFDGFEMGLFPLVARPALQDLLGLTAADEKEVGRWFGVITAGFLVGAATGGVLFGWLGDRLGRVRAMTLSVLTYAVFSGLCGLSANAWQVAGFRFIAALGMGGEWSLGVALVMEIWPNRSRALMAGLIGAAANVGYLLVAGLSLMLDRLLPAIERALLDAGVATDWTAWLVANSGWRLLMLLAATPAVLTFFIRLFVPESESWQREQGRGATSHWVTRDLLGVLIGAIGPSAIIYLWANDRTTLGQTVIEHAGAVRLVGTLAGLAVATLGYLYPVIGFVRRATAAAGPAAGSELGPTVRRMLLGACLAGVALLGTWGSVQWIPTWASQLAGKELPHAKAYSQIASSLGAVIGTILGALAGDWLGRRWTYCLLCLASLGAAAALFQFNTEYGGTFLAFTLLAGLCTASFYGWLPLYLPELFPTRIRATGQGFGFNFGRILAAIGTLQTGNLMQVFDGSYPKACSVMSLIYLVGLAIIWLAPETKGQELPA